MLYNWCVRINFGRDFLDVFAVEAYTALWIEIDMKIGLIDVDGSRLIQPRGLKFDCRGK